MRPGQAFRDTRTGGWGSIILQHELLSDAGSGQDSSAIADAASRVFGDFLAANAASLGLDPDEVAPLKVTVHDGGRLIQIHGRRVVGGVPVRGADLSAVLNSGKLVLFGLHNWAQTPAATGPAVAAAAARVALTGDLVPFTPSGWARAPRLELAPFAGASGLSYRLVWVFSPIFQSSMGTWEGLVDAMSGEVLAFRDLNQYATPRGVVGAVLPVSNDNRDPDGIEQAEWPMPFADLTELRAQRKVVTDSGGNAPVCMDGPMAMSFDSQSSRCSTSAARRRW